MKLALVLKPFSEENLAVARQMGVTDIVTTLPRDQYRVGDVWPYEAIVRHQQKIADAGLTWSVVESVQISDTVKLGLEGRDREIDDYCQTIVNLGAAGVHIMCWNWMAVFGWMRTSFTTRTRGNALSSSYDHALMEHAPLTEHGEISQDQLWETLEYFLKRVIPVAEEAGVKQGIHPDDPPLSPIRGISRIVNSVENFDRILDLYPSEYHGVTFCQGNFTAMGVDIPSTLKHFGKEKIPFAHFRDLHGKVPHFSEAFHDDGDTDMAKAIQGYMAIGFDGPIRPDHTPTFAIDENETGGYNILGRLFAVGYMRGLIDALESR
jgi:mannonate dehydratase